MITKGAKYGTDKEYRMQGVKDGVIIWDSLGKTSDSSRSHQEIGLKRIYLEDGSTK